MCGAEVVRRDRGEALRCWELFFGGDRSARLELHHPDIVRVILIAYSRDVNADN